MALEKPLIEYGYRIPGVSRVIAATEMAYNEGGMRRNERKAVKWKDRMDAQDTVVSALDKQKSTLEAQITNLGQRGMPGTASLQVAMQNIERRKTKALNKKDKYQTKFEKRDNKVSEYVTRRDAVADRMIGKYEAKLKPIEKQLDNLKDQQNHLNLDQSVMEADHKNIEKEMDQYAKDRAAIIEMLGGGWRATHNDAVKAYDKLIADGYRMMDDQRNEMNSRKIKLDDYVAKLDQAANPHRDKRDRFVRAKQDRSVDFGVSTRTRAQNYPSGAPTRGHTRVEAGPATIDTVVMQVADWNDFLENKYGKGKADLVSQADFLATINRPAGTMMDRTTFIRILGGYYLYHKLPLDKFKDTVDEFLKS